MTVQARQEAVQRRRRKVESLRAEGLTCVSHDGQRPACHMRTGSRVPAAALAEKRETGKNAITLSVSVQQQSPTMESDSEWWLFAAKTTTTTSKRSWKRRRFSSQRRQTK